MDVGQGPKTLDQGGGTEGAARRPAYRLWLASKPTRGGPLKQEPIRTDYVSDVREVPHDVDVPSRDDSRGPPLHGEDASGHCWHYEHRPLTWAAVIERASHNHRESPADSSLDGHSFLGGLG